ncbi:hypothetical protein Tco_0327110 [Tanacetum coccineum]
MSKDVKVPLILGRPFLSTVHAKIDVFKRKITLRVGDEKIIFKSVKPASSLIKRVYMLSLRERMELDLEARLMGETLVLNRSLDPLYGDYIELNDLNVPLELRRDQVNDLMPIIEEGEIIDEPMIDIIKTRNNESFDEYPSFCDFDRKIHIDCAYNLRFSCMIGFEHWWKIWMATEIKTWEILFLENRSAKLHVWKQKAEWNLAFVPKTQEFLQGGLKLRTRICPRCEDGRMAQDEEYVVVKEGEYEDLTSTSKNAC